MAKKRKYPESASTALSTGSMKTHCLFIALLLLSSFCWGNAQASFRSGETALQQGEYRQAMLDFQQAVREASHAKIKNSRLHRTSESNYVETEDATALIGLAHFERGNYLFQSNQKDRALDAWTESLQSLAQAKDQSLPARAYLALFLYANAASTPATDLTDDTAFRIADILDSLPKSSTIAEQPRQAEAEFAFITGYRTAQQMLASERRDGAVADPFSDRIIYSILLEGQPRGPQARKSHESMIDDLLFSNADIEIAKRITQLHYAIIIAAPKQQRAILLAQHLQWLALCNLSPKPISPELMHSTDDWSPLGDTVSTMLQQNRRFRIPHFEQNLWQLLTPHLSTIKWPNTDAAIQVCSSLAKNGFPEEAQTMAAQLFALNLTQEQRINTSIISLQADFNSGKYRQVITLGEQLLDSSALSAFQKAEVHRNVGLAHAQMAQSQEAIQHIQAFLNERPVAAEAPSLLFLIATLYLNAGMQEDAKGIFEQLLSRYPQSIYTNRARQFLFALQQ